MRIIVYENNIPAQNEKTSAAAVGLFVSDHLNLPCLSAFILLWKPL